MRLEDFRFRLTDTSTGESAIMSFNDLYGYEGEANGVLVDCRADVPASMRGEEISFNSGYGKRGLRPGWDIEVVEPGAANPIVETGLIEDIGDGFIDDRATRYIVVTRSGNRDDLPVEGERVLSLNVGGETRDDGYHELSPGESRLVAAFLGRSARDMPPAGRIVVLSGMRDGLGGCDVALAVRQTIAAALLFAFGQDDMSLWDDGKLRVLPDPASFRRLLEALGADIAPDELAERERRFVGSHGHARGLRSLRHASVVQPNAARPPR